MMKVMIADDEKLVRAAISDMLVELGINKSLIIEVSDGQEFLDSLKQYKPEIAFVDIQMPLLNGLEAIAQGKNYSPETSYYVLTGYGEFEYAKKAIELKVSNYLLKPVDMRVLENIIKEKENLLLLKSTENNLSFNSFILAHLYNNCNSLDEQKYQTNYFKLFYICIDHKIASSYSINQTTNSINTLLKNYQSSGTLISVINISLQYMLVVLSFQQDNGNKETIAKELSTNMGSLLAKESTSEQNITIIETDLFQGYNKYTEMVKKIKYYAAFRKLAGVPGKYGISELMPISSQANYILCGLIDDLITSFSSKNYIEFVMNIDKLADHIKQQNSEKMSLHSIESIKKYIQFIIDLPSSCLTLPADAFFEVLVEHADKIILKKYEREDYITATKSFIESNYMQNIGITGIAEQLKISANYLSTLFHVATGKTFKNYLTDIRMMKAKELLIETDLTVENVSKNVGYFSVSHFIKLFTQYFGCLPSSIKVDSIINSDGIKNSEISLI